VAVLSDDPFSGEGAVARLAAYREIALLGADRQRYAQVLLVLTEEVTDGLLRRMESAARDTATPDLGIVLVAASVAHGQVLRAAQRTGLASGLTVREVEVLRLLSEGLSTGEVAAKLNYSERTVKYIVAGVLSRLKLRNRTHAVAHALRSGAL
jgi:DNA-binding CsgD family transcriptional regulator